MTKSLRIVTRPDFDGIVCSVLLKEAENIVEDICWVEPGDIIRSGEMKSGKMRSGSALISYADIIANLPYVEGCYMWFDHHVSNLPQTKSRTKIKGAFEIAPSAARVVYKYYQEKGLLQNQFDELVLNTDVIDAADLSHDQIQYPEKYPYILLSMTVKNREYKDKAYWNQLVDLLSEKSIMEILKIPNVSQRCNEVIKENADYEQYLKNYTKTEHSIAVTDFRSLNPPPEGNRFLIYSLFPETMVSVKIRFKDSDQDKVLLSIGKNIFNRKSRVNIGELLAKFGGGGHDGAGGCTLDAKTADRDIEHILNFFLV